MISTVTRGPAGKITISANISPILMGPTLKDCLRCTDDYRMISTVTRGPAGRYLSAEKEKAIGSLPSGDG